jgi:hypothetical protein
LLTCRAVFGCFSVFIANKKVLKSFIVIQ